MDLAIIAAGDSSRIFLEGMNIPKALIEINGTPIIERIIKIAKNCDLKSVKCIINERNLDLYRFLKDTDFGLPIDLIVKSTPSSMHSLFELSLLLKSDSFCLTTCDSIFREDEFFEFIIHCKKSKNKDGILAVTDFIDDERPLYVKIGNNNKITSFEDKNHGYKYITGGIYYFSSRIFVKKDEALRLGIIRLRNFLRFLINSDFKLFAFQFSKIIDVDHVSDIKTAEAFLNENIKKNE